MNYKVEKLNLAAMVLYIKQGINDLNYHKFQKEFYFD